MPAVVFLRQARFIPGSNLSQSRHVTDSVLPAQLAPAFLTLNLLRNPTMTGFRLASVVAVLTLCLPLQAQLPQTRITSVFPPGGMVDSTVDVTVGGGADLDELDSMMFSHPGITATRKLDANGNPVGNTFAVAIAADVPAGLYDCRVRGLFGISNPRLFRVDTVPEIVEAEANNTSEQATAVTLPAVVNARANGATDVDFYKLTLTAGQTIVVRTECDRLDSPMQPVVQLFNPAGRRVLEARRIFSQESSLVWTAQDAGDYLVRVQDAVYGGGDQFVYRLVVDSRPMVDWISPNVVSASQPQNVYAYGRHLPDGEDTGLQLDGQKLFRKQVSTQPDQFTAPLGVAATGAFVDSSWWTGIEGNLVRLAHGTSTVVGESAETPEQSVTLPADIIGSFAERGDEDIYLFDATKDQKWAIEVFAQRIGSIADPLLLVERGTQAADGTWTWARVATEDDDRQNPGGANLPTLSDDPSFQLAVPEDGRYRIRISDRYASARGDGRLQYRIAVRQPQPDYSLVVFDALPSTDGKAASATGAISLRKGGNWEVAVYAYRRDGHNDAITLEALELPEGITCHPSVMGPGQTTAQLTLSATEDCAEILAPITIRGTSGSGDAAITRNAQATTLVHDAVNGLPRSARLSASLLAGVMKDQQPYSIEIGEVQQSFSQEQQLLIPVKLIRRNGFNGKVDFSFYNLPGETDAPAFALEPDQDTAVARVFFKEKAPVNISTVLLQGTATVPYTRNPWLAERAQAVVTAAEARQQELTKKVTDTEATLRTYQETVVKLTADAKTLGEQMVAMAADREKMKVAVSASIKEQTTAVEAVSKAQQAIAGIKASADSSPEDLQKALNSLTEATKALEQSAVKVQQLTAGIQQQAQQIADVQTKMTTAEKQKTEAEAQVVAAQKEVETATAALDAAKKEVEAANAAKTAADAELKKAQDATKPQNVAVRTVSRALLFNIHASPVKVTAAVPDSGSLKKGASMEVKVTLARRNEFAGPLTVTLVPAAETPGLAAAAVEVPADQNEATLTITAAADAAVAELANTVIRATGDFGGRQASSDVVIPLKIVE